MAKAVEVSEDQFEYVMKNANVLYYMRRDDLARDSKVPRNTINKILQGITKDPSVTTIRKLYLALKKKEKSLLRIKERPALSDAALDQVILVAA